MLYKSGELSLVGCYLRLHPCLEELTPTHPLQLMVTRVLMALGTENVDGFEGPHWSAAQATWFWSVRSEIQWPSSPSKSSFKSFSGFTCTLNIFFAGLGSNSSSLQLSTPDAPIWMCSSAILSAFGEEVSLWYISKCAFYTGGCTSTITCLSFIPCDLDLEWVESNTISYTKPKYTQP